MRSLAAGPGAALRIFLFFSRALSTFASRSGINPSTEFIKQVQLSVGKVKSEAAADKHHSVLIEGRAAFSRPVMLRISIIPTLEKNEPTSGQKPIVKVISLPGGLRAFSKTLLVPRSSPRNRFRLEMEQLIQKDALPEFAKFFRSQEVEFSELQPRNKLLLANYLSKNMRIILLKELKAVLRKLELMIRGEFKASYFEAVNLSHDIFKLMKELQQKQASDARDAADMGASSACLEDETDSDSSISEIQYDEACKEKLVKFEERLSEVLANVEKIEALERDLSHETVIRKSDPYGLYLERLENELELARLLSLLETAPLADNIEKLNEHTERRNLLGEKWSQEFPGQTAFGDAFIGSGPSIFEVKNTSESRDEMKRFLCSLKAAIYALDLFPDLLKAGRSYSHPHRTDSSAKPNPEMAPES